MGLTWWPVELTASKQVDVEVGNGFAGVGTVVDHEAKTFFEVKFFRNDTGGEDQVAECGLIGGGRSFDAWDDFLWND